MATIKELAARAGVSIGTVDRVLHNRGKVKAETEQKVLSAIKEMKYSPNQVAQGLAAWKKKVKILFVLPDEHANPYYRDIRLAAEAKAQKLQEQYGVNVLFYIVKSIEEGLFSIEGDRRAEIEEIDGMVTLGTKFKNLDQYLAILEEQGKPVVFYNDLIEDREYLAYVGCDYIQAGRMAAGLCALAAGADAKVYIYSEGLGVSAGADERIMGFRREMEERYPDMEIIGCEEILRKPELLYDVIDRMIAEHPEVNCVYVMNPGDYSVCKMIHDRDKNHKIRMITNDITDVVKKLMDNGIITATICQEPEKQGAMSLDLLVKYLLFGTIPADKICYTKLTIHIAQNMN